MQLNKFIQLHIIILLWGFTPILGKLISFGALDLVWYRLAFSLVGLYLFMRWKGEGIRLPLKSILHLSIIGAIVGLHWYLFYHSIKVSNVSVAMVGFSTLTLFASIMQPVILKRKLFWGDIAYGLVMAGALGIIFRFETDYINGIIYGILAALTSAYFGVYNGKLINSYGAYKITFYEFLGALVFITLAKFFMENNTFVLPSIEISDFIYLTILSVLCTVVAFTWSVEILKLFSPLTVIITNNLEPVYGIVFSLLLFGESEYMSTGFYIGAAIILISVFAYPVIKSKFNVTD
ncbi:MAG: DMT family transporter [Bacteroidota bacterium]|jgi:drug/metabolite transporter (DMT)-like permease